MHSGDAAGAFFTIAGRRLDRLIRDTTLRILVLPVLTRINGDQQTKSGLSGACKMHGKREPE
jgi:hypothetical protein